MKGWSNSAKIFRARGLLNRNCLSFLFRFDAVQFLSLPLEEQLREIILFPNECFSPKTTFSLTVEWMKDPSVFVCRFEDLVGERAGGSGEKQRKTVQLLAERLGYFLPQEEIAFIADQMYGGTWTYRNGQILSWKEAFSEENKFYSSKSWARPSLTWGMRAITIGNI